jgi:hypothetical protein
MAKKRTKLLYRVKATIINIWWKLLLALARFAGLRTPSESFSLTWNDIDWERGRISVPSPKAEASGKTHRVIPLFPMLRPYLDAAFAHAEEGATFVLPDEYRKRAQGPGGWANANLRTTLEKVIRRAGVEPWPRLWHSLRASCESDLAQSFPLSTVSKWLGNTPSVALRHYVDPTEVAFEKATTWVPGGGSKSGAAAQKVAQRVAVANGGDSHEVGVNDDGVATCATPCDSPHEQIRRRELNPSADSSIPKPSTELDLRQNTVAASGQQTRFTCRLSVTLNDPELRRVIETWDALSEPVKKAILALLDTTSADRAI